VAYKTPNKTELMIQKNFKAIAFSILMLLVCNFLTAVSQSISLRAPAYPLITIDPYTSAWSFSNELYNDDVRHWTGKPHSLTGVLRVDGKVFRFLGKAELPFKSVVSTAESKWSARYTFEKPKGEWTSSDYDASSWRIGEAAFGTEGMPFTKTRWDSKDIWVRREITLSRESINQDLYLEYSHDDNFELYFNGIKIVDTGAACKNNARIPLPEEARKSIRNGKNIIAAHCLNTGGAAYVDFGLFQKMQGKNYFAATATQRSVSLTPTQTKYQFDCGAVTLNLDFASPLLLNDLELVSRPVGYVSYSVRSKDSKEHQVEIYFEASPEWAVHTASQEVTTEKLVVENLTLLKTGTRAQNILKQKGDDVRIDWGYFYFAGQASSEKVFTIGDYAIRKVFAEKGKFSTQTVAVESPLLAYSHTLGNVGGVLKEGRIMLGYDDVYAVQYFGKNLEAWWKKNGKRNIIDEFKQANAEYKKVIEQCSKFDKTLVDDAVNAGGDEYAALCALAYRQAIAAHKLVRGENNEILFLSKENFSNGSIGTVDVTYPSAPLFLLYNPDLLKGMLNPILDYSESGKWTKPFAAHDVGTYPLANGQTYGDDMPVEESGNILILTAAIAAVENNADYANAHWKVLTEWATYLEKEGFDPENQLCTDDFAGHIARNANLSIKAILGLASYAKLAGMLNQPDVEEKYKALAKTMAAKWVQLASDGDHYTLTFENAGTWSQKYNLVWDRILALNIFPETVAEREIPFYLAHQNKFGLPLDSRRTYTKSDWIIWTATLSTDKETFKKFIHPLYVYVTQTPDRAPLSDWHETTNGSVVGFRARSVVGGYFIKILSDQLINNKADKP
jgi:hypothetical protein